MWELRGRVERGEDDAVGTLTLRAAHFTSAFCRQGNAGLSRHNGRSKT